MIVKKEEVIVKREDVRNKLALASLNNDVIFFIFAKGHVCVGYSVASTLITPFGSIPPFLRV